MPEWGVLAIFVAAMFVVAQATKGLVKYVSYIIMLILAGATIESALSDWRLVLVGVLILTAVIIIWFYRRYTKKRKDDDSSSQVHIHNHTR